MLLSVSNTNLYFDDGVKEIKDFHQPFFLLRAEKGKPVSKIDGVAKLGNPVSYNSWAYPGKKIEVQRIYTEHPSKVPPVSTEYFKRGFEVFEYDCKYIQRVLIDMAVERNLWIFDTKGKEKKLKFLCYDLEKFSGSDRLSMVGIFQFDITIKSSKLLRKEKFEFEITKMPIWKEILEQYNKEKIKVNRFIARDRAQEISMIDTLIKMIKSSHVIIGHNVMGYDNPQLLDRIKYYLANPVYITNKNVFDNFRDFIDNYATEDETFNKKTHKRERTVAFHPCTIDTLYAANMFFTYMRVPDFKLKNLARAKEINIKIKNRVYLHYKMLGFNQETYKYNADDIIESVCLGLMLLPSILPVSFQSGLPPEQLLTLGNIKRGDYMELMRGVFWKKIVPTAVNPQDVANLIQRQWNNFIVDRATIVDYVRNIKDNEREDDLFKIAKMGSEMPEWVTMPQMVFAECVGGLPIKPQELGTDNKVWFGVMNADANAMYPTILRAKNATSENVRFALKNEKPDDWIRFWHIHQDAEKYLHVKKIKTITNRECYLVGIKIHPEEGLMSKVQKGVISVIAKFRERKKENPMYKEMYNSVKAVLRNSLTHGIILAVDKHCRQYNTAAGDLITSKGMEILEDMCNTISKKTKAITVEADTDGVWVACYKSIAFDPKLKKALKIKRDKNPEHKLSTRKSVKRVVMKLQSKWAKELHYKNFLLECEDSGAILCVGHKNYCVISVGDKGKLDFTIKGAVFKGKNKALITRTVLEEVLTEVLKVYEPGSDLKKLIERTSQQVTMKIDLEKIPRSQLILIQNVKSPKSYTSKSNKERAILLEEFMKQPISGTYSDGFLVCKTPLPGATPKGAKPRQRPILYMKPADFVEKKDIDLQWYREMIIDYIYAAFGMRSKKARRGPAIIEGQVSLVDFM